jgi:predicted phage tail protein
MAYWERSLVKNLSNVKSCEAVKALSVQVPGFEQFMLTAHEQGLAFAVFQDDENISEDQIDFETGAKVIKIVPKVIGAGGNGVCKQFLVR